MNNLIFDNIFHQLRFPYDRGLIFQIESLAKSKITDKIWDTSWKHCGDEILYPIQIQIKSELYI